MENQSSARSINSRQTGNPWIFVPVLYFLQGAPYFVINAISVIIFKKLGIENDSLLFWTSLIAWPWTLKMLWSPIVDSISTKTRWVIITQALNALCMVLFAFTLQSSDPWTWSLLVLMIAACVSATHDIASDGLYLIALTHHERSLFVGLQSTAYRFSRIFVTGALVALAGSWESSGTPMIESWSQVLLIGALTYLIAMGIFILTRPRTERERERVAEKIEWAVFLDYLRQPKIYSIIFFILFYRFGESMVGSMSNPFLLDPLSAGGMGLSTIQLGKITGVVGVIALSLGGIVGGVVLSKWGLKRSLLPMVFSMYLPNLFYLWAAWTKPSLSAVYGIVFVDQFGYGFGFSAYLVFMMFIAQGSRFQTAHYAISTALMAAGATLASSMSGFLQVFLKNHFGVEWGYPGFFAATFLMCIPGLLILRTLPLEREETVSS
ncbi:MAG: MFS transporter [Bdellovibrionales bacterium]|nr:MFS transporter [Bdellovibrionales bacterium]